MRETTTAQQMTAGIMNELYACEGEFQDTKISDSQTIQFMKKADMGTAEFYALKASRRLKWNADKKEWMIYDAGRWQMDVTNGIQYALIKDTLDYYYNVIQRYLLALTDQREKDQESKILHGIIAKLYNNKFQRDIAEQLKRIVGVREDNFDQQAHLLNCKNGTFNVENEKHFPFQPEDFLTKQVEVPFLEGAECPKWVEFNELVFENNQETIAFMQKWLGTCLTAKAVTDTMLFCFGHGANGKSTYLNIIQAVLGDYACTLSSEVLMASTRNSADTYELMKLKGARLGIAEEVRQGWLNESRVKQLVGTESINARNPFERAISFKTTHQLIMTGNHKPNVKGSDYAIWRRMRLIPFTVNLQQLAEQGVIKARNRESFVEELLREEGPGILNWMIEGLRKFKQEGLRPPASIADATDEYRAENDTLGAFLKEKTRVDPYSDLELKVLYERYRNAMEDAREPIPSTRTFAAELRHRGMELVRVSGNKLALRGYALEDQFALVSN